MFNKFKLIKQNIKKNVDKINNISKNSKYYSRPISLGISGSNNSDLNRSDYYCSTGTLGFLIQDSLNKKYIISNAHVLVGFDPSYNLSLKTAVGDNITQPGDVDNNCSLNSKNIIAKLNKWTTINPHTPDTEIDVALAEIISGKVTEFGEILGIGLVKETSISNAINPIVGKSVRKSGRTTGITTGIISLINANVVVEYDNPKTGNPFNINYKNVIFIHGTGFSAPGDSGSLVFTNDSSKQPIGLLFAGSTNYSIAFPIKSVLNRIEQLLGKSIIIKGFTSYQTNKKEIINPPDKIININKQCTETYKKINGYIASGIFINTNGQYEITILSNRNIVIPNHINGVKLNLIKISDKIKAL